MKKSFFLLLTLLILTGIILSACSGSSASFEGEWTLVSYNGTPALPNVETSINFGADGQFSGNVGCNGFGSEYKVSGDEVTFGAIVSTMMYCEAVAEQESAVIAALSQNPVKFQLDGRSLTLTSADGASISLTRK